MGLASALSTALTGLSAAETQIDVIGNNLANVSTPGFWSSRTTFSDILSFTISPGSGPNGNFGGKNEITQEPALALLSKKAGRPVKGVYTRPEEFPSTTPRHPIIMDYKTGVSNDGRIRSSCG